jgi:hypothetical protein
MLRFSQFSCELIDRQPPRACLDSAPNGQPKRKERDMQNVCERLENEATRLHAIGIVAADLIGALEGGDPAETASFKLELRELIEDAGLITACEAPAS